MSHDTHFLSRLARVSDEHVSLALSLYRDTELVRDLLGRAQLPDGVERVALALEEGPQAPHVVLARDGHFVTCLGPGMTVGELPIISRARLDAAMSQMAQLRERLERLRQLNDGGQGQVRALLEHVLRAGPRASREEFVSLSAIVPFVSSILLEVVVTLFDLVRRDRLWLAAHRRGERWSEMAAKHAANVWGLGHLLSLALEDPRLRSALAAPDTGASETLHTIFLFWPRYLNVFGITVRTLRGVGALGKPLLRTAKERLRAEDETAQFEGMMSLLALGAAHPKLRAEATKVLGPERLGDLLENPGAFEQGLRGDAREAAVTMLSDDGRPLFDSADQVPDELALAMLGSLEEVAFEASGQTCAPAALVTIGATPVSELYLPQAYAHHLRYSPAECGASFFERWHAHYVATSPARRPEGPGRNEPCSCGSGRKHKKCCGA